MDNPVKQLSTKRLMIDKANTTMLVVIGVSSFIVVFSLIASKALLSQNGYQSRVIKEKKIALTQLNANNKNVEKLVASYKTFAGLNQNVIGGNPAGNGPNDGDNPKIILDALPSKYDFPAVISSMEKVLKEGGYTIDALGGTDDEIAQQSSSTNTPMPVEMPFPISVSTTAELINPLLNKLEKSIRPIYVNKLAVIASKDKVQVVIDAKTYYQPEKILKITTKVIK